MFFFYSVAFQPLLISFTPVFVTSVLLAANFRQKGTTPTKSRQVTVCVCVCVGVLKEVNKLQVWGKVEVRQGMAVNEWPAAQQ